METSSQDNSQLYSSPLHQKVPNDMSVSSSPRRRESIILPILLSSLITALVVGGGMYYIHSNTTQSLNSKIMILEEKMKADSGQVRMTDKIQTVDNSIPPLQGGQGDVSSASSLPTNDKGLATNLVTYQDPNIPALRFSYNKGKWKVNTSENGEVSQSSARTIQLENALGILTFKINDVDRSCNILSLRESSKAKYDDFYSGILVTKLNNSLSRHEYSNKLVEYFFDRIITKQDSNFKTEEEYCLGLKQNNADPGCPAFEKNIQAYTWNCTTGPRLNNANYVSKIRYTGKNVELADEIVKQISLD
jgi:hypothetical protein